MPFPPALSFSYTEFANFTSYEEVREHTDWPADAAPPGFLQTATLDNIQDRLLVTSNYLLQLTREQHPILDQTFVKLEEHSSIFDIRNFKIYLALKGSYETWAHNRPLPYGIVNDELKRVTPRVKACVTSLLRLTRMLPDYLRGNFNREEKAYDGQYTSDILGEKLAAYHTQYHHRSCDFLYPYTTIVGPSTKGKSFSISQLAIKHHKYVIYLNFNPPQLPSYPHTTCLAHDFLESLKLRDTQNHEAWSRLVGGFLRLARLARRSGIGPKLFFLLQTDPDYAPQQILLRDFMTSVAKTADWSQFELDCRNFIQEVQDIRSLNFLPYQPPEDLPRLQFIVCIDGASSLLKKYNDQDEASPLFHSLRCALKDLAETEKNFFATFVDKSAEIIKLFPAIYEDPDQRPPNDRLECRRLFPPFFQFLSRNSPAPKPVTSESTQIMSLDNLLAYDQESRPEIFKGDRVVFDVPSVPLPKPDIPIVRLPVRGLSREISGERVGMLAMLSYRIAFDISSFDLAERLVFERLYDITDIPDHREQLLVTPPDESTLPGLIAMWNPYEAAFDYRDALDVFKHALRRRFISVNRTEFAAGLISLITRHAVMAEERRDEDFGTISIGSFLTKLLGLSVVNKLKPASRPQSRFERMLSFGRLSFHRISRRQTPTSILDIYEMYRRCAAAVLPTGSTGGNILIPVWVPGGKEREAHIGCIIIRVKGCDDRVFLRPQDDIDYIRDAIDQFGLEDKVPVIGLTMYLNGCEDKNNGVVVSKSRQRRTAAVVAVGLDSDVYPLFRAPSSIGGISAEKLHQILAMLRDVASPDSDVAPPDGENSTGA
ncbi:hypothetical protein Cpir12675_003966 [Ceratocystis pirilliformis]|uniref:Uncharacterized protein n=1 Tax=Ceratocystis pirilliformis TaxID=259994 RepID=A0ABR3Z0G6_9PEZI